MTLKFLADECTAAVIVRALRDDGHDVVWIAEEERGMPDREILARAARESRVLLTEDKDFGEIVIKDEQLSYGVCLLRLPDAALDLAIDRLRELIRPCRTPARQPRRGGRASIPVSPASRRRRQEGVRW